MKIQYGTPSTLCYALSIFLFGAVVFAIGYLNVYLQRLRGETEESILLSRKLNLTNTPKVFHCNLRCDDCLCSVLLNKSNSSENCIIDSQIVASRILLLISFFLQIFLVRELFSLIADHRHIIIYALWIVSFFTVVGMIISIFGITVIMLI
jgi:hypothetical protein